MHFISDEVTKKVLPFTIKIVIYQTEHLWLNKNDLKKKVKITFILVF